MRLGFTALRTMSRAVAADKRRLLGAAMPSATAAARTVASNGVAAPVDDHTANGHGVATAPPPARKFHSSVTFQRSQTAEPALTVQNINPNVVRCEYAVRGAVVLHAQELEKQLQENPGSLPFDEVVYCNIGNPQALGQPPITFFREVLALCDYPKLLEHESVGLIFSQDAIKRARCILEEAPGGTGAYSESKGLEVCRRDIAAGIERRDGYPANYEDIYITDGASAGVHLIMQLVITDAQDAVMVPIPQYPLYSASIALHGGTLVPYYLNEGKEWGLDVEHLRAQLAEARGEGVRVRAMVVINPGNPTGQCLSEEDQREVVNFCAEENLVLLADEVYQENVYAADKKFTSFKKIARDMGLSDNELSLISFHSVSKGYYGECGRRGGYMELCGIDMSVKDQLYKLLSVNLCSNVNGQIMMSLVSSPPHPGDPSYNNFDKERSSILESLKKRAKLVQEGLNRLEGIICNPVQGALYAFPRIDLPRKAVAAALELGQNPDTYYVLRMLDATGVVVVPGSGFGQEDGTYHFRTTILPPLEKMASVMDRIRVFHEKFFDEFRD
eukprot:jgi/Chlat1/7171/Chrsp57S06748